MNTSTLPFFAIVLLQLIAILTTRWSYKVQSDSNSTQTFHMGLWKNCTDTQINKDTNSSTIHIPDETDLKFKKNSLHAVRALVIIGFVCVVIQCYLQYYNYFPKSNKNIRKQLLYFAGFCTVLASLIWVNEFQQIPEATYQPAYVDCSFGYSLYLNLISGLLCIYSAYIV